MSLDLETGSSQWVNGGAGSAALQNVAAGTVMGWVLWETIAGTVCIGGLSIGAGGPTAVSRAAIERNGAAVDGLARRLDTDGLTTISGGTVAAGALSHVALVMGFTTQSMLLYLNGVQVASATPVTWTANTSNTPSASASVGAQEDGSASFLDGRVQDFRSYQRALSAAEILRIFLSRGRDGIVSGLFSRFKMIELAPGSTASGAGSVKNSGLGGDATPTASPVYAEWIVSSRRRRGGRG